MKLETTWKKTDRLINSDCDVKVKRTSGPDK